ncbi:hypothetical protein ACEPAF_1766 [Sanghuangporus sanghuang]
MNGAKGPITVPLCKSLWPTVLRGDAASAATLLEKHDKPLWYLAYGSNLNSSVFKRRRGIKPLEERHVLVEGLELAFDLPGLPYVEPRFANCRFATGSSDNALVSGNDDKVAEFVQCRGDIDLNGPWTGEGALIGVAYLVAPKDFACVIKTEGGGSGYKIMSVQGRVFRKEINPGEKKGRIEVTGEMVRAYTLFAPEENIRTQLGQPSVRYLTLIREGAKEHQLPPGFLAYLESVTPYSAATFRQKLGAAVTVALGAPPFIVVLLLGLAFAHKDGRNPHWINKARGKFMGFIWRVYDKCMLGLFGNGERTVETVDKDI